MNLDGLLALYRYNAYANQLLFETVARLDGERFTREISPTLDPIGYFVRQSGQTWPWA